MKWAAVATLLSLAACARVPLALSLDADESVCDGHGIHVRRNQNGVVYSAVDFWPNVAPTIQVNQVHVREVCYAARTGDLVLHPRAFYRR